MAHWPEKLLANDFEEKLIQYMSTPIGKTSTGGLVYGSGSTSTPSSSGAIYVPVDMKNTNTGSVSLRRNSSTS